jgi:hypothetical protein
LRHATTEREKRGTSVIAFPSQPLSRFNLFLYCFYDPERGSEITRSTRYNEKKKGVVKKTSSNSDDYHIMKVKPNDATM